MFGCDEKRGREEELATAYQCHQESEADQEIIFALQARLLRLALGFVLALALALLIPLVNTIWQVTSGVLYCRQVRPYDTSRLPA